MRNPVFTLATYYRPETPVERMSFEKESSKSTDIYTHLIDDSFRKLRPLISTDKYKIKYYYQTKQKIKNANTISIFS
jgi:hypothetical protein